MGRMWGEGPSPTQPFGHIDAHTYLLLIADLITSVVRAQKSVSPGVLKSCSSAPNYAKYLLISFFPLPQINWHLLLEKGLAWKCKNAKNSGNVFGQGVISAHIYWIWYGLLGHCHWTFRHLQIVYEYVEEISHLWVVRWLVGGSLTALGKWQFNEK